MEITPEQIRAARALLRLEQADLAQQARVSVVTLCRLEEADGMTGASPDTVDGVRKALEQGGAEFIPDGVRRRPTIRPDAEERLQRLRAIMMRPGVGEGSAHPLWTEDDLYDENGLPA